jgi:hypothetical protein
MLSNIFSKTKYRNSGMLILMIIILQFSYVNFVGQKEYLMISAPHQILDLETFNNELLLKRHIKPPAVSQISMSANLNCQIQANQIKCKDKDSATESVFTPPQLPMSISSTQNYSCMIDKDSGVQCWYHNIKIHGLNFIRIHLSSAAVQITSSNVETCSLLKTGEVFCWKELEKAFSHPAKKHLTDDAITSISSSGNHHCAANDIGNVICWGDRYTTSQSETSHIQLREKALRVSTGPKQDCIITKKKKELICWNADYSQLAKAPNLANLHEVSLSEKLSCGLTYEGNVYCWQNEDIAKLTLQLNNEADSTKLISMSSNNHEICGLTDDQRMICWNKLKK